MLRLVVVASGVVPDLGGHRVGPIAETGRRFGRASAARGGDFDALVAVLDPDVVLRADGGTSREAVAAEVHGAEAVAVMGFTVRNGGIVEIDAIADPERLRHLDLAVLDD